MTVVCCRFHHRRMLPTSSVNMATADIIINDAVPTRQQNDIHDYTHTGRRVCEHNTGLEWNSVSVCSQQLQSAVHRRGKSRKSAGVKNCMCRLCYVVLPSHCQLSLLSMPSRPLTWKMGVLFGKTCGPICVTVVGQ